MLPKSDQGHTCQPAQYFIAIGFTLTMSQLWHFSSFTWVACGSMYRRGWGEGPALRQAHFELLFDFGFQGLSQGLCPLLYFGVVSIAGATSAFWVGQLMNQEAAVSLRVMSSASMHAFALRYPLAA